MRLLKFDEIWVLECLMNYVVYKLLYFENYCIMSIFKNEFNLYNKLIQYGRSLVELVVD